MRIERQRTGDGDGAAPSLHQCCQYIFSPEKSKDAENNIVIYIVMFKGYTSKNGSLIVQGHCSLLVLQLKKGKKHY